MIIRGFIGLWRMVIFIVGNVGILLREVCSFAIADLFEGGLGIPPYFSKREVLLQFLRCFWGIIPPFSMLKTPRLDNNGYN